MKLQELKAEEQREIYGGLSIIPVPNKVDQYFPGDDEQRQTDRPNREEDSSSLLGLFELPSIF